MPRGKKKGSPKTGGRVKGSKNKRTLAKLEAADRLVKSGKTPLEFLLAEMRKPITAPNMTFEQRMAARNYRAYCANQAAPYLHPRLASVEHRTPAGGMNFNHNVEGQVTVTMDPNDPNLLEAARRIAFVMAMGARAARAQEKVVADVPKILGGKKL